MTDARDLATPVPRDRALVSRRGFLKAGVAVGGVLALGPGFWRHAYARDRLRIGESPYGPLQGPDANGLMLPDGFTSRVVARANVPVEGTTHPWHLFPDGGHCFATGDGGWIYCCNSENPPPADQRFFNEQTVGGAGAIRFDADGRIVDAYPVLEGTISNCAGGPTPWGTWLSCEEYDIGPGNAGHVWEVDPFVPASEQTPKRHDAMGIFKHEMAAVEPDRRQIYLSEDQGIEEGDDESIGGLFYRYTPDAWPDLGAGLLEAAVVTGDGAGNGSVSWVPVPDPLATDTPTRFQLPDATHFDGGEGCWYDSGRVYLTTKGDERVWEYEVERQHMRVLYDPSRFDDPVLRGVDNIIVSAHTRDILVAEDGDNMEVVVITPEGVVAPLVRATGPEHGADNPTSSDGAVPVAEALGPLSFVGDIPTESEITGLAFTPDGSRLYLNSQRGGGGGITYEVSGPFVSARRDSPYPPDPDSGSRPEPRGDGDDAGGAAGLPATGGGLAFLGAAGVALAAAVRRWTGRGETEG